MDKEMLEQFQMIVGMMEKMATKEDLAKMVTKEDLEISRRHTEILIENTVTKRIDALADGYKLNHEKQFELERETHILKAKMDCLEVRLSALENKTA